MVIEDKIRLILFLVIIWLAFIISSILYWKRKRSKNPLVNIPTKMNTLEGIFQLTTLLLIIFLTILTIGLM